MAKPNGSGGRPGGPHDYEVGYKKPPTHSRWKKGQSGNKRGRPKKKLGISDIERAFDEALAGTLSVNDNGTVREIKKLKAFAIQTVNKAVKGHHPSASMLLAHYARRATGGLEEPDSGSTAEDFRAEMEAAFREIAAKSQSAVTPGSEAKGAADGEADSDPADETPLDPRL